MLGVVFHPPLAAQEGVEIPRDLTFPGAVAVALEHNPAFQRQQRSVDIAEYGERQALGSLLPSLSGSLGFNANTSRSRTAVDEFGQPLEVPDFVENTTSSASQGVSGSVQLLDFQSLRNYSASQAETAAQMASVDLEAARLRTLVGTDYFDIVRRNQLVAVEEQGLETAREQLAAIRTLLRLAARQPTDVLGAELDVARAEQSLQQAQGEARKARLALREQMGVPMETPFEVVDGFPAVFDPSAFDTEQLIRQALSASPRVVQQVATVDAAERSLSAARAARLPSLSGSYRYGRGTSARDYDAFGQFDLPNSGWGFGVNLSLPLFNRLQTSAAVGRAAVQVDNAEESLREARLALEREVRAAMIDLENAYAGVILAERAAELARERLRQGQELYRQGSLQDYTALQQMIDAVNQEARGVANAHYNFAIALLTLEEKVGGPLVD